MHNEPNHIGYAAEAGEGANLWRYDYNKIFASLTKNRSRSHAFARFTTKYTNNIVRSELIAISILSKTSMVIPLDTIRRSNDPLFKKLLHRHYFVWSEQKNEKTEKLMLNNLTVFLITRRSYSTVSWVYSRRHANWILYLQSFYEIFSKYIKGVRRSTFIGAYRIQKDEYTEPMRSRLLYWNPSSSSGRLYTLLSVSTKILIRRSLVNTPMSDTTANNYKE